ncbi:MAG: AAA family ATPase [Salibacter sp.]|uniref:AAA family ATPase n=1 Tax=Salibacter sp. TaxID=2010995 RepID=UPI002870A9F5|nr:AAA family ATPase [Salibacter sp.]MDR9399168.1 AAA family ATPase [Salibacter sp.]
MRNNTINQKLQVLESARETLKNEFVGLDKTIDQLIHYTTPWYTNNEFLDRPLVVNLWGLTGTGKTALINRFAELIDQERNLLRFDFGDHSDRENTRDLLYNFQKYRRDEPRILVFDEIQHINSINKTGEEVKHENSLIWELLDSGKLPISNFLGSRDDLYEFVQELEYYQVHDVEIKNLKVVRNRDFYLDLNKRIELYNRSRFDETENVDDNIIKDGLKNFLYTKNRDKFNTMIEFIAYLNELDLAQLIEVVKDAAQRALRHVKADYKNALIFVIGNIDEAYDVAQTNNSDLSSELVKNLSSRVGLSEIKEALLKRFRAEQIARLGNNHIIYPAFGEREYSDLVEKSLEKYSQKIESKTDIQCHFDPSLKQYLLKEGVTPSQGVRPLLSTISNTIGAAVPHVFLMVEKMKLSVKTINWKVENGKLLIDNGQTRIYSQQLMSHLENRRKSKRDDTQAVTAVHEAGHALLGYLLLGKLPMKISSQTTSKSMQGFVEHEIIEGVIDSKKTLDKQVAILYGGIKAEEVLFGKENITLGASNDISKATDFIVKAFRDSGMGDNFIKTSRENPLNFESCELKEDVEKEIEALSNKAKKMAEQTLLEYKKELIALSRVLADQSSIDKTEFIEFVDSKNLKPLNQEFKYRDVLFELRNE